jgi:PAS domain S-box-containing protein
VLRLSLQTRGFVLVGFPLLCQLTFICILLFSLLQTQEEIRKRTESRDLVAEVSRLDEELIELTISFNFPASRENDARQIQQINSFDRHLQRIEQLVSKNPNCGQDLKNLQQSTSELFALFSRRRQHPYAPKDHDVMEARFLRDTRRLFTTSAISLNNIIATEESIYAGSSPVLHTFRADIKILFVVAAITSVLGAIVLGYVFALLISKPIKHLSANVRLLSKRKQLSPLLDTRDDFAALDQVLHDAAQSIEHASISARALVENAEDLICSFKNDGTFISANHYAAVMLGFGPDELIGRRLTDIVLPEDNSLAESEFEAARLTNKQRSFDLRLRRKDGSTIDTKWSCFWSSTDDSLFCVINDITEQRRNERLKQDFVEMIRQDLHAPLTAMASSLIVISEAATDTVSTKRIGRVQSMLRNIERLIVLVNALLESQKFSSSRMQLKLEYCDLQLIVVEAVDMVRSLAEAKKLNLELSTISCNVLCDKEKLREIVVNLLANAIKFTPPRTRIHVSFQEHQGQIEVRITDQGPGVPDEFRESIFQAFEQMPDAKESRQGVGLGLAICKLIVQAHGGSIGVTSSASGANFDRSMESRGSTFWFRIAAAMPPDGSLATAS